MTHYSGIYDVILLFLDDEFASRSLWWQARITQIDVSHLSTSRSWVFNHGLQELWSHDDGLVEPAACVYNLLLHWWYLLKWNLGTQVSSRNHGSIRDLYNVFQVLQRVAALNFSKNWNRPVPRKVCNQSSTPLQRHPITRTSVNFALTSSQKSEKNIDWSVLPVWWSCSNVALQVLDNIRCLHKRNSNEIDSLGNSKVNVDPILMHTSEM